MTCRRSFILAPALALPLGMAVSSSALADDRVQARADWARFFTEAEAQGCIVVLDARGGSASRFVFDGARAGQRMSPASTFKIPHSLFALDAGIIRDEFQVLPWDGVQRPTAAWNADQTLRSAMRHSTVWVYERIAAALGPERERAYLQKLGYGNAVVSGAAPFWVEGDLAISAFEQIALLQKLYRNELPFEVQHQRLVKDVMVNEAGPDWILRAKTGWTGRIGWWVGWIEWPGGPVFFALNIDTPKRMADVPKRQGITRAILRSIGAWPTA